jgi:hypothetical protein
MTLNLNAEIDASDWTPLQTEICMNVALAKRDAFITEAQRVADYVRCGFLSRATAADYLQAAADYNSLSLEYGVDDIQKIMASAFDSEVAA